MTRRLPQVPPPAPSSRPRRRAPAVRAVRLLRLMALTAMCGGCDPETPLKPIACEPDIGRFRWSPDGAVVGVEVEIGNLDPCPDPTATWRVDATEVPACTTALVPDTGEARATTDCDVPRTAQEVCVVVFTGSMSAADRCEELSFECPPPVLRLDGDWASGDPLSLVEGPQLIRGVVEAEGDDPGLEVSAQALDADGVETARATAPSIGADGAFELLVDTDPDTDRVVVTAERTDCDEQMVLERAVRVRPAGAGPTCALLAPEDGGVSAVGLPVVFEMSAADAEDPANALRYALRSDRDGELDAGAFDSSGYAVYSAAGLSAGWHFVELECADLDGFVTTAGISYEVDDCWRTVYPDRDGDGFGDTALAEESCSARVGYVTVGGDCDEDDPSVHPGAAEACNGVDDDCDDVVDEDTRYVDHLPDLDADGYGDPLGTPINACAPIPGYAPNAEDCADDDASVHPGATEVCNGQDDDCDDDIDDADADLDTTAQSTFYLDADVDGFGDSGALVDACAAPPRYSPLWGDCDDGDALVHPAATEVCNGVDDDCDSRVDDADASLDPATRSDWYTDNDRDGHGAGAARLACAAPAGTVGSGADCDDTTALAHPGAAERCDGIDNDCDGLTDDADPTVDPSSRSTYYADADGDSYGGLLSVEVCTPAPGYIGRTGDCDDTAPAVHPAAAEVCNSVDDDCDGAVDDLDSSVSGRPTWYPDADADLYGDAAAPIDRCIAPVGHVARAGDCDDSSGQTYPGAPEVTGDGVDQSCDGAELCFADADSDGYRHDVSTVVSADVDCADRGEARAADPAGDCADTLAAIHPGATEVCDGVDNDCDLQVDDADGSVSAASLSTWYRDADADAYGTTLTITRACVAPTGFVGTAGDCDDAARPINPSATEVCDTLDNDCDGQIDDSDAGLALSSASTWYRDADLDGYGASAGSTRACLAPSGYVASATDCDDGAAGVSPAASEVCDLVDNDCDSLVDDADPGVLDAGRTTFYRDLDADLYGDPAVPTRACALPSGHALAATDCVDSDASIRPGATEVCDGLDNDCDTLVDVDDPGVDTSTLRAGYRDADADGYGDTAVSLAACSLPAGYVATPGDCDDTRSTVSPARSEACDALDNNCDGAVDESLAFLDYFPDADSDGYGTGSALSACSAVSGRVTNNTDCDDTRSVVRPGAAELCDSLDNDCDGSIDESLTFVDYFADADRDGYGAGSAISACAAVSGRVTNNTDCNDASSSVRPGATELVGDGVDQNCDSVESCYTDADRDGYAVSSVTTSADTDCTDPGEASSTAPRTDCDDAVVTVNPGAAETVGDGVDQTCDGRETCYTDADNDGYRLSSTRSSSDTDCLDSGEATATDPTGDCNDGSSSISPAASEVCDGVDNDCDGSTDEGFTTTTYYRDADGDGYGTSATTTSTCGSRPSGYVTNALDCDDSRSSVKPGATESCNGRDDDCDGSTDEGGVCGENPGYCADGLDNDGNGYADCQDTDCAGDSACRPSITSVSCTTMERGSATTCTVTGSKFMRGATAFVGNLASPVYTYVSPTSFQVSGTWICNHTLARQEVAYLHPGGSSGSSCTSDWKACATMTASTVMGAVDLQSVTPASVTGRTTTTFTMSGCNLCPSSGTPAAFIANVTGVSTTCSGTGDAVYYRGTPTGATGVQACAIAHTSGATGRYRDEIASCVTLR